MKCLKIILCVLLLAIFCMPVVGVLASDISNALFFGVIAVSNDSTATTNVATVASINTTNLINGGYLNAGANNTAIRNTSGADVPFMPGYTPGGYPWCMWVPTIGEDSILSYILYTANTTGGEIRYFPADGGMTTPDNATLELADNFTIEQTGWVDTDNLTGSDNNSAKNLVLKEEAFRTFVSANTSGIIISAVHSGNISPTGFVDPSGQWLNEPNAFDNNIVTYANRQNLAAGTWSEFLELTHAALLVDTLHVYAGDDVDIDAIDIDVFYAGGWHHAFIGAYTEQTWIHVVMGEQSVTSMRIRLYNGGVGAIHARIHEAYFTYERDVTATSITSANRTVETSIAPLLWAPGDVLDHDGTLNSFINCGALNHNIPKFWVSFWFKLDAPYGAGDGTRFIFAKAINNNDRIYVVLSTGSGDLQWVQFSGGVERFRLTSIQTSWNTDQWYHVIGSISDTAGGIQRLLIDGNLDDSDTLAAFNTPNGGNVIINNQRVGVSIGIEGQFANAMIGIDNLTTTEERHLYNGIAPGDETDLWYIDEGTGINIVSYGTVANAGTANAAGTTWDHDTRPCKFTISVDTPQDGFARPTSVPDNSENWTFINNYSMLYMASQNITIDGVLQQDIVWEYSDNFTDLSGQDHWAIPTFRTASSDADVSANLTSFLPVSEAQAPDYVLGQAPDFIDPDALTGNVTDNFTITPPTGGFPLAGVIAAVAAATSTPSQLPLLSIAGFVILTASLVVSSTIRRYGSGSLIVKIITITAFCGIFIALQNFGIDFWMLVTFLIISTALAMASRQLGWS